MSALTPEGKAALSDVASRHGVSTDAAETLLSALVQGQGTQAQFNHPDLGGMGQWSQGGMTMVGDMFNNGLKATVDALCHDLSGLLRSSGTFAPAPASSQSQSSGAHGTSLFVAGSGAPNSPWPAELGAPSSAGAQNNMRYAIFPATRRLAIDLAGKVTVYDTADHQIFGVGQQQSGDQSLTFTSQNGLVRLADLKEITPGAAEDTPADPAQSQTPSPAPAPEPVAQTPPPGTPTPAPAEADDIIALIQKLADLHASGILTDAEFEAKKTDLLARL
ncbi:SHOCT domain-containing protein [Vannielia sp.]|uniref:SHOCT domain-containing protein n=1 Tax=Vannielia sp. TaxID=2813045 RepID=UPI00261EFEFB|nr:SHOCT domain-containing protein [Vannielia sp.]MDF1872269.1 SHOCT domain-containing protein [Vannielia sp.]